VQQTLLLRLAAHASSMTNPAADREDLRRVFQHPARRDPKWQSDLVYTAFALRWRGAADVAEMGVLCSIEVAAG
jgi:hypothetical protein